MAGSHGLAASARQSRTTVTVSSSAVEDTRKFFPVASEPFFGHDAIGRSITVLRCEPAPNVETL
nr:hypothetical protein [Gammaproteobacteria bacterium]